MALKDDIKEQLYIQSIIAKIPYFKVINSYNKLLIDSNSAIELAKNPLFHHRIKYIDI